MSLLTPHIFTVVSGYAVLTAIGQIISLVLVIALLRDFFTASKSALTRFVAAHALTLMLIVAVVATSGSLFLSEVAQWSPCKYCWIQRIFMYPQIILLAIALWKRDANVARYIFALSIIGLAYATYHYFIQMQNIIASSQNPATPCDPSGESCVKTPFVEFGYITIPMMALVAFLLNLLGSVTLLRSGK